MRARELSVEEIERGLDDARSKAERALDEVDDLTAQFDKMKKAISVRAAVPSVVSVQHMHPEDLVVEALEFRLAALDPKDSSILQERAAVLIRLDEAQKLQFAASMKRRDRASAEAAARSAPKKSEPRPSQEGSGK